VALLLLPVVAWLVTPLFGGPPMPRKLTFAVHYLESADADYAKALAEAGRRVGIQMELQALDEEALARLASEPERRVDLAFVRSGLFDRRDEPALSSLGNMYLRPVWLFHRRDAPVGTLADLGRLKLGLLPAARAERSIERRLLALNNIDLEPKQPTFAEATPLVAGLLDGTLQAIILQTQVDSLLVQLLLRSPGITLYNDKAAKSHAARMPDLTQVTLPAGIVDGEFPAEDTNLLATNMALVARPDLPDELLALLLAESEQIFKGKGLLHEAGQFPNSRASSNSELPLAPAAADYYRSGAPLLTRWLPFWLAALLPRMVPALLVVALLFIPLLVLAPRVHDAVGWVVRRGALVGRRACRGEDRD
jgi:hypothetical protein